jgi:predicted regulator of Ras-like GTPase activity (Roadblock/LC7/MglB family)
MSMLEELLTEIRNESGGDMIQITVCGADGMAIASSTIVPDKELAELMTGRAVMALTTGKKVTDKLNLGAFEEAISTTEKAYIFLKFIGDGSYSVLASFTKKATLGTVRMLIQEYSPKIWDAIPR